MTETLAEKTCTPCRGGNPSFEPTAELPGGLPVLSRPGGSPLQLAANGWCAESFFAVTSEDLGSPFTARARASLVAR